MGRIKESDIEYWLDVWRITRERVEELKLSSLEGEEKERYLQFMKALKELPEDAPPGDPKELFIHYEYAVKPHLPWEKIKHVFNGLEVPVDEMDNIIFHLKPRPIEPAVNPSKYPIWQTTNNAHKEILNEFNKKIKNFAPIIKKLEKLAESKDFSQFIPMKETIFF